MSDRDYYNRMRKDLQALKKQVLSFDAQKRKECGYLPIVIPKAISHTGRPISSDEFEYRLQMVTATTFWLQSILDKLNGLTSSCAIDMLKLSPSSSLAIETSARKEAYGKENPRTFTTKRI